MWFPSFLQSEPHNKYVAHKLSLVIAGGSPAQACASMRKPLPWSKARNGQRASPPLLVTGLLAVLFWKSCVQTIHQGNIFRETPYFMGKPWKFQGFSCSDVPWNHPGWRPRSGRGRRAGPRPRGPLALRGARHGQRLRGGASGGCASGSGGVGRGGHGRCALDERPNLVGGLEHFFYFPIYWESSSQLTNIFQRGSNHQPANSHWLILVD